MTAQKILSIAFAAALVVVRGHGSIESCDDDSQLCVNPDSEEVGLSLIQRRAVLSHSVQSGKEHPQAQKQHAQLQQSQHAHMQHLRQSRYSQHARSEYLKHAHPQHLQHAHAHHSQHAQQRHSKHVRPQHLIAHNTTHNMGYGPSKRPQPHSHSRSSEHTRKELQLAVLQKQDPGQCRDFCAPMGEGCPVECAPQDNLCHQPSQCEGCEAYNWCSPPEWPCPLACGDDQISCWDDSSMTEQCHPKATGCPVNCAEGENVCQSPPMSEGDQAWNWCSPAEWPCPLVCGADQISCWNDSSMTEECHPKSAGCPVNCAEGENVCQSPPMFEGEQAWNWCSPAEWPCPLTCGADQVSCWDDSSMTEACFPKSTGCPANCPEGDNVCRSAPMFEGDQAWNWCSPPEWPCPMECGRDEILCYDWTPDWTSFTESCAPKSSGCPVTCDEGFNMCREEPYDEFSAAYNWCSEFSCPVTCPPDQVNCWLCDETNPEEGGDFDYYYGQYESLCPECGRFSDPNSCFMMCAEQCSNNDAACRECAEAKDCVPCHDCVTGLLGSEADYA
jgi:hypothetical protein